MGSSRAAAIGLVAVLDVSGSMAGTKLALLTRAMSLVIESLGPNDRLSVIAFHWRRPRPRPRGAVPRRRDEVRLSVRCAEQGVLLTYVQSGGYASTVDGDRRGGFVDVGDLYAGEERDFLFTAHVPATPGKGSALLVPTCTYRAAVPMETVRVECVAVVVQRPPHPVSSSPMSVEVERERHRIHAMEVMATVGDAAEQGDFVLATSILEGRRMELESRASVSVDARTLALVAERREMKDRLETRRRYEVVRPRVHTGRPECPLVAVRHGGPRRPHPYLPNALHGGDEPLAGDRAVPRSRPASRSGRPAESFCVTLTCELDICATDTE
ncbi:hypothetical protein ACQ4PT_010582 [Festuca glaucescens]